MAFRELHRVSHFASKTLTPCAQSPIMAPSDTLPRRRWCWASAVRNPCSGCSAKGRSGYCLFHARFVCFGQRKSVFGACRCSGAPGHFFAFHTPRDWDDAGRAAAQLSDRRRAGPFLADYYLNPAAARSGSPVLQEIDPTIGILS